VLDIENHYAAENPHLPKEVRELLHSYVAAGKLGIKTGEGFYKLSEDRAVFCFLRLIPAAPHPSMFDRGDLIPCESILLVALMVMSSVEGCDPVHLTR
jgi:3-hydroxyacyl-CoA dehydrogenase